MDTKKVLVVEDEIIVAEDIAERLRKLGYTVAGMVTSGEEAIEQTAKAQPDLVLMDIVLEGDIDGVTAAENIRNAFQIPVVFLTAYADEKTLQRAKLADPFGYILKPFQQKDLQATIEIAIHRNEVEKKLRLGMENLESLRQIAEEKSKRKNHYVSMAAHELRNPLTTILASTKLLEFNQSRWDEESKLKCLHLIHSATQNMNQLIEDMLIVGRTENDQIQFNPVKVNLSEFCQELLEQIQLNSEGKHHLIFLPCDRIVAMVDRTLIRHILSNLLSNAIKYSPQGGKVLLEMKKLQKQENAEMGKSASCNFPAVIFRIQDEGIGIPKEDRENLFTAFHRCGNVGGIAGNGLGLAIVKKAVELHGGTISFESEEGVGTTFTVTLPCEIKD